MKKYDLGGKWRMTGGGYDVEGVVPGSVYSFLYLDNKLLPDPYYRDNEDIYTALMEHEYTFERQFCYAYDDKQTDAPISLVFEGLDTLCTVYLNEQKLGDADNMHLRYSFNVNDVLKNGENCLKVVFHPLLPYLRQKHKENRLFGATDCIDGYPNVRKAHSMMGWDWGPRLPDAGVWRDVYLLEQNSGYLRDVHILQTHRDGKVILTPQVSVEGDGELEITLISPDCTASELIPNRENLIEEPKLWWPNRLGEQNLYEVKVVLREYGRVSDEKTLKIGLRELKLIRRADEYGESFYHEINGVDMFAMGADYIPEDNIFSRITPERTRTLLQHCKNCNFNAIRVWGGGYYPDDDFFELCDELGLVVFLDLMFACSVYEPDDKMKESIKEEVKQNLERIRHHACIALVCGNNEIEWHFQDYVSISGRADREHLTSIYLDLFESFIPAIVAEAAPYLPYIPSSPTSTGGFRDPNGECCGDCHDWEPDYLSIDNRFYRYVSEFGFQSLPSIKTVERYTAVGERNLNSRIMEKHQRSFGGNELILTYLSKTFCYPSSLENLIYASQLLQAESVGYRVEHFRRNRGRCMGALYWQLNDIWPVTSWSSIDYYGRYKALQYAAKRFYSPILLSCKVGGDMRSNRYVNVQKEFYGTDCKSQRFAELCVVNDTLSDICGVVKWERRNALGDLLDEGCFDVSVPKLSSYHLEKLAFDSVDVEREHLSYSLLVDGAVVSEGSVLFASPKYYCFEDPCLSYEVQGDELIVRSQAYARAVQIEGDDDRLLLSDNYFDMEKGERRIRILRGKPSNLTIRSVFDIK